MVFFFPFPSLFLSLIVWISTASECEDGVGMLNADGGYIYLPNWGLPRSWIITLTNSKSWIPIYV